jgi:hypothetical protein
VTYAVVVEDWREERRLIPGGGILLYQHELGPKYNALSRPIADGDEV